MSPEDQSLFKRADRPLLLVLSGLSGAGKDAVLTRMRERGYPLRYITTVTTRYQRAGEKDGVHYHFTSAENFQRMIDCGDLLEWANVYGNWYGVPREPVKQALDEGWDTIIKVDVQGAATIKKILPQAVFIFLTTPSIEELALRLKKRSSESPSDMALRIKTAEGEIKQLSLFDYIVFNRLDDIDGAVKEVGAIITAEKCRVTPREVLL
jgi:guanylate kinase